jgi:uncharacterized membrane protein
MALFTQEGLLFLLRWIHFLAGITWIGMLYYFNFVQTPFFGTELGGTARGAMMRGLVPNALWWFRWGAMFTFLSGWTIVIGTMIAGGASSGYYALILTGGLFGSVMWTNVWFVIWPIQRIAIASAESVAKGGQADPAAAARAPFAARASRTNVLLSIPMLFFMGSARHLTSLQSAEPSIPLYWVLVLALTAAIAANPFFGTAGTQKPLGTVSGTIHAGLGITAVLYVWAEFTL